MEKSRAQRHLEKLPPTCYAILLTNKELIRLEAGMKGFHPINQEWVEEEKGRLSTDEFADKENEKLGVTKGQRQAMETGSMYGWEVPGANPDIYDVNGKLISK